MHHIRNHRKMQKPKFDSSSSDDDTDHVTPLKWKPIVASFPIESNAASKQNKSNPIIDSLNSQTSKQQKLSAEVIQKEEIYNQAEMEANKKMFGCANPGRCLSKDEIKRRKDIILHIVNERLKSKLSELMGEFGERLEMNDSYGMSKSIDDDDDDRIRYRNRSPQDYDSKRSGSLDELPPTPPPPTFNTSSSESDDDLDFSLTKEFELYEKEIKEKISDVNPSKPLSHPSTNVTTTIKNETAAPPSVTKLATSYNSIQVCPLPLPQSTTSVPNTLSATPMTQNWNILQHTSTNLQQNWQQPQMPQWSMTAQLVDVAPWIPPVGPPQTMDPFPPPIETDQMITQHIPSFIHTNPPPPSGWMPSPFTSNYSQVPQYPNPDWVNNSQSLPYLGRPSYPPQRHRIPGPAVQIMNSNVTNYRPSVPFGRSTTVHNETAVIRPNASVISAQSQIYNPLTTTNNVPIVSKSTYVNAILAAEQKSTASHSNTTETKSNFDQTSKNYSWNEFKKSEQLEKELNSQKRPHESHVDNVPSDASNRNSSEVAKRLRPNDSRPRQSRFDNQKSPETCTDVAQPINSDQGSASLENRSNYRNSLERKDNNGNSKNAPRSPQLKARHEKTNTETFKLLSKYWSGKNADSKSPVDFKNSKNDQMKQNSKSNVNVRDSRDGQMEQPVEWIKLCDIVNKLLDLSPSILKDLPSTDRRVKERNDLLKIISDDPGKLYAYVDKYGEEHVNWSVKMAQRVLFPQGRHDDRIASAIAPYRNAINTPKPKEWIKMCKIVDNLLDIPTRIMEDLPSSDNRVKERNHILMILSNNPEDFLLQDEKYGAHNVDWAILAAKRVMFPDGVYDDRVHRIMLRQRENLMGIYREPSENRQPMRESRKRSKSKSADRRSRSIPKEWNQLCDIVDKVLDTPFEIRIKLSKKDPRWELRDDILLVLSDNPDQLVSQSDKYGPMNVDWAIKSAKKVMFPNGLKDKRIVKKLSPQRKTILRNRETNTLNDDKTMKVNQTAIKDDKANKEQNQHQHRDQKRIKNDQGSKENAISKHNKAAEDKAPTTGQNVPTKSDTQKNASIASVQDDANVEIDETQVWKKLCNIVDKLLDLPPNATDKLPPSDKRLIERDEILMILSEDPDNFSQFDGNYGDANVSWAIKSAKKLIYPNGKPNDKLIEYLWSKRDAIISTEQNSKEESKDLSGNESSEWIYIRKIATKVFQQSMKNISKESKSSKETVYQQIEFLLQLSDNPDIVRTKEICQKIGKGRIEVAIAKCKHILNRLRKLDQKALFNFEYNRSRMVLYLESQTQSKNIKNYDVILDKVRKIVDQKLFYELFGEDFNKWSKEQKLERNELAILMMKDPYLLKSNAKYLEMVLKTENGASDDIIAEVEKCLRECEYKKEDPTESGKLKEATVCAPIIATIKDVKYMSPFMERKLTKRIHRLIEQFLKAPKPEVFDVRFDDSDGTVNVVCANLMTYNWLKNSVKELDGLWPHAKLTICEAPILRKVLDIDDLKQIKMTFKTVPTDSFAVIMKKLKKTNPKLHTERWQSVPSHFSDSKKMLIMVDLESLIELERSKREINVDNGTIYFDIKYIGRENFETKC